MFLKFIPLDTSNSRWDGKDCAPAGEPIAVQGTIDNPTLAREIRAFEADDVENLSQRYANDGYARRVRAARCHGPTGSDWS